MDRHPYRTNPRAQEVIDKCVDDMEAAGIIEKKLSEWGSPVCIVAKADGSPRFCVDDRTTINKFLVRETWPMLRKTVIPSEAISHRKTVVRSNANPLLESANPDLARIKRKIIRRGENEWCYLPFTREWCYPPFTRKRCDPPFTRCIDVIRTSKPRKYHTF